jgi:formate/nitrite transporter FocA (FNT family)
MRRFQIPEIILGSLLTVAIFTIGVIFGLRTTARADAEVTGFSWLMKDAAGFFTFGLVLVTAIQATMFYIQLRYMRRGMRDAMSFGRYWL